MGYRAYQPGADSWSRGRLATAKTGTASGEFQGGPAPADWSWDGEAPGPQLARVRTASPITKNSSPASIGFGGPLRTGPSSRGGSSLARHTHLTRTGLHDSNPRHRRTCGALAQPSRYKRSMDCCARRWKLHRWELCYGAAKLSVL